MSPLRNSWPVLSTAFIAVAALAMLPSHGSAAPQPTTSNVLVVNPPTSPIPVSRRDNPARQPWQAQVSLTIADGEQGTTAFLAPPPPGKRIVVEFGSAFMIALKTQMPTISIGVSPNNIDPPVFHTFALTNAGSHSDTQFQWQSSHPLSLYVVQGFVTFNRANGNAGPLSATMSLSGHLEDVD